MISLRQLAGRTLYWGYHVPLGRLRSAFLGGGPREQNRTEAGRIEMEAAVAALCPMENVSEGPELKVHLLTGSRFWYQTAFCLHSFEVSAGRQLSPSIYDDGSLRGDQHEQLFRLFPRAVFVSRQETEAKLEALLPGSRFPRLRERWENYPNLRKLIDPHLGSSGWKLVMDSDLLFFRSPEILLDWIAAPAKPLHAIDLMRSYGYSDTLLRSLANAPLHDRLNVGLCGLRSDSLDWERIEHVCETLISEERTNYYLEQALVAVLLAGVDCVATPYDDYVTGPRPPEALQCRVVMHHYVADTKRWYFQSNWRRFVDGPAPRGATKR